MTRELSRTGQWLRGILALILLVQVTLVQAMAASSHLHHECHHDSHDHDHQCEVTLWLQTGGGEIAAPVTLPVVAIVELSTPALAHASKEIFLSPPQFIGGISAHSPPRAP